MEHVTTNFDLQPKEPFTIFALQIGGFLPLCFTGADILMVDRNVVINASNILRGGKHRDNKANTWWHSFINEPRYLLNPAFAAFEGRNQSIPTFREFCEEFERCCGVLTRAFPDARVISYSQEAFRGAYALVEEVTRNYGAEVAFLQEAAPLVTVNYPRSQLQDIEDGLFARARNAGLGKPTFSFIACLSCLYKDTSKERMSPGRLVLKPKPKYTRKMAHNALMDLYALQLLIQSNAKLHSNIALCTSDKGLLRFWCAVKVKPGGAVTPEGFKFNLEFSDEMFPRLDGLELLNLRRRVEAYDSGMQAAGRLPLP